MPSTYKTPGVYIEEVPLFPPSVAQVETAIPVFIGYTEKASELLENDLLRKAKRISSMREYEQMFGGAPVQAITVNLANTAPEGSDPLILPVSAQVGTPSNFRMYHALQMYFANGGGPCYIISVGDYSGGIAPAALNASEGTTPGGLAIAKKVDEITLLVFPDANGLTPANYHSLYSDALAQAGKLQDRFAIMDVRMADTSITNPAGPVNDFRDGNIGDSGNFKYGAVYYPYLETVLNYHTDEDNITFAHDSGGALDSETLTAARGGGDAAIITDEFENLLKAEISKLHLIMPPSPIMAGIYARTDSSRGVWKAPANTGISSVVGPVVAISHEEQMDFNVHPTGKSVNAIRSFVGKGTLVWGARTLAGNDNEWRYVPVRRLFNMVEESTKKASEQFVFEPNDANTWVKIKAMIENYLTILWRQGALAGATTEDAFYVKVGLGETMTAVDILEGKLIVEIGMAAVRPAEFIILRFMHKMQES